MSISKKWAINGMLLAIFSVILCQPVYLFAASAPAGSSGWTAMVAKAKEEGKLVVSTSQTPPVRQAVAQAFKAAFGVEMEFIGGGKGAELATKLLTERRNNLFLQDIYIGGTTSILTALKPAGALDPLEPVLVLPEVLDKKLWLGGDYWWCDRDKKVIVLMLQPNGGQSCIVNTTMVKPGEIKVYDDFLNPKWKGQIVMNDPTVQGPGLRFVGVGGVKIKSWDYMKELTKQKPMINRDQRLQVEWVARGRYAIGLGMEPNLITEFIKAGAPIVELALDDESTASAGPNDLAMINKAAHPNAAKVFVNWILSKEGQTVLSKASGLASVKTNVPTDHLTPARRMSPTKKYFVVDHEEYILKEPEYMVKAKEVFADSLQ